MESLIRGLSLQHHNTRVVLAGTVLLGATAGIVGVFMLLRRRSLIGDVVGHASLPGIAIGFLVMELIRPGSGKSIPVLWTGAFLSGIAGALCVMLITRFSRIKTDAALAIVLSVFYGTGTALLTVVQKVPSGSAAGLKDYLNGKTAALVEADVQLFAIGAVLILGLTMLLFKELALLCFDEEFAAASGWPTAWLDAALIGLVAAVTMIGMQSVGLLLISAVLIIPGATARFWTDDLRRLVLLAGLIGAASSGVGVLISASAPKLAAGATIVLTGTVFFLFSLLFGRKRGLVLQWRLRRELQENLRFHQLLRMFAHRADQTTTLSREQLCHKRGWSDAELERIYRKSLSAGWIAETPDGATLTSSGHQQLLAPDW